MAVEGEYFGQIRPPLSVTIKGILDKYPDGQIFKELIQNADDAKATEVKFILDHRDLSTLSPCLVDSHAQPLLRNFSGPALLAYNDAVFTESDWVGIQNLQQSRKADDPFKVGKFGIGFNSVYHITDLPVIVSGRHCVYLDPQEHIWKDRFNAFSPGKKFDLTKLYRETDVLDSFNEICGFKSCRKYFPATLIRLPLRKCASRLSDNCYDPQTVQPLIASLREEAKYILLFLNSVKTISLTYLHNDFQESEIFGVALTDAERSIFTDKVRTTFRGESPYSVLEIVSGISSCSVVVKDVTTGESQHDWLVAQQVGSTNPQVMYQAARQYVLPWVGTAVEVTSNASIKAGRLFCFLPMPREATAPIPVHVNGTFALSDNRRSLKWPAEERQNDAQAKWNKLLVEHCLPSCYVDLIVKIMELGVATPERIYMAWPVVDKVKDSGEWNGFLEPFFLELFQHKVVYSKIDDGCWIRVQDAVFVPHDKTISSVVETVLLRCKIKVTAVSQTVWSALISHNESVKTITPLFVRQILKENAGAYQSFTSSKKLNLLRYCLKDDDCCDLIGLQLLPLVNGEFDKFSNLSRSKFNRRYLCSKQVPNTLLPHSQDLLVDPHDGYGYLHDQLENVASHRCTQLRSLRIEDVARLLANSMLLKKFSSQWLKTFWLWVQPRHLYLFMNLSIVPVGSLEHEKVVKLSNSAGVIFVPLNKEVTPCFVAALAKYGVELASEELYSYLKLSRELMNYVHQLDGPGVLNAIYSVCSIPLENVCLTFEEASAIQSFFDDNHRLIAKNKCTVLQKLAIFYTLQCQCVPLCSIEKVMGSNPATGQAIVESDHFDFDCDLIPQAPLVISKANNQTHLLSVLGNIVVFMNKIEYLCQVLLPMISSGNFPETKMEAFMVDILKQFTSLTEKYSHQEKAKLVGLLRELRFLKNFRGEWKCPTELFDPGFSDLVSLFKGQDVFPVHPFNSNACLASLRHCGLRGPRSVNADCITVIIKEIGKAASTEPVKCDSISNERAISVANFASCIITENRDPSLTRSLKALTNRYSWLPVYYARPPNYPKWLPWKGTSYKQHLASSRTVLVALHEDIEQSNSAIIMGSEVIFVHGVLPVDLAKLLSSSEKFLVPAVLNHLSTVIAKANLANQQTSAWVERMCKATYRFLNFACSHSLFHFTSQDEVAVMVKSCYDLPFIFTGNQFVKPSQVSKNCRFDGPYLYSLPRIIQDKTSLLDAVGVKDYFDIGDLFSVLKEMYEDNIGKVLSTKCCKHVNEIISMLNDLTVSFPEKLNTDDVYLPDESYTLHRASDLSIKESWCTTGDNVFVSERLTRVAAIKIGVKTVSSRFLQTYNSSQCSFQGDPFGQQEQLTCRIKNIIREYPFDKENATLLKELMQNADDAKATKMCIILDKRMHKQHKVLSEKWTDLQGPALVVWNDAEFTERDLKGIQQLGLGSKRDDSESIGQFGIGFNVVYHITDCPSFLTGGTTLCIFDPHCRYAPGATPNFPGRRFDNLDEAFWTTFSDLKSAYLRDARPGLPSELLGGSLFRFPLRHTTKLLKESELVDHVEASAHKMEQILHCWMPQIKESLIFLNHITHFSFYVVSEDQSCLKYCFEVQINESDKLKRSEFCQNAKQFRQNKTPTLVTYCLSITDKNDQISAPSEDKWLVQQGVGDVEQTTQDWSFARSISPKHGLAALLPTGNSKTFKGKAFCFLPLPVNTNLPVHVNGQFVLSSSRRSLWTSNEKDDVRKLWNEKLVKAISSSYARFLVIARQYFVLKKKHASIETALSKYYQLFPYWEMRESQSHNIVKLSPEQNEGRTILTAKRALSDNPESEWKLLGQHVFKKLWTNNEQILACFSVDESGQAKFKWCNLCSENDLYGQAYFRSLSLLKDESMQQLFVKIGMSITDAPDILRKHFQLLKLKPFVCSSKEAFNFFIMFHKKILPSHFPTRIVDTVFQTTDQMVRYTEYITTELTNEQVYKSRKYHQTPFGYPLLLTADKHIRVFDSHNNVISSQYTGLFPNSSSKFLHPSMVALKLLPDYFSNEQQFEVLENILQENFPIELCNEEEIDNSDGCFISWKKLQSLWKCFHHDTVFMKHQKLITDHFTLIPTSKQHLFSTRSPVLPLVSPERTLSPKKHETRTFKLLDSLGLPIFDESKLSPSLDILYAIQQHCVQMSEYSKVLETLYHFHTQTGALTLSGEEMDKICRTLLDYFKHIFFRQDENSARYIKSLPLFKTVNGTYTSISEKEVYAWPDECCEAGYDKWVNIEALVFLEGNGEWNCLDLSIDQLSLTDMYTKFIFKSFKDMNTSERKKHLLYIRDKILMNASVADKEKLLAKLKLVACLEDSQNGALLPVSHFSDPNVKIFQIFSEHFKFPSKKYSGDEWLEFFKTLGLKTVLKVNQFIKFCEIVASGSHHRLHDASDELLDYLFSMQNSFSSDDLAQIRDICFVRPDPLPRLNWIKTPCTPVNSDLQLTTLRGAAVSSCAKLVWTVMPVVNVHVPRYHWPKDNFEKELGIITLPSNEDVYNNVLSISKTALTDFKLFGTYHLKDVWKHGKTDIVSVICANFRALEECEHRLRDLVRVPCIPVIADVTNPNNTFVLVNSLQVVWSMDLSEKCLEPYINELPPKMHSVSPTLEIIGVTQRIGAKHLEYTLKSIHCQIGCGKIRQNQLLKVRTAILKMMEICSHDYSQRDTLTELFLPCHEGTLVKSINLLVDDSQRYNGVFGLDYHSTSYKLFILPHDTSSDTSKRSFLKPEVNVCLSLPEKLRPKRISVSVEERNTKDIRINETESELCEQLSQMIQFHQQIKLVLSQSLLEWKNVDSEKIATEIAAILEKVKVQTVTALHADLFLTLDTPPSCLGRRAVPFLLSRRRDGSFLLSVDSMESVSRPSSYKFWRELSHCLCIETAKISNISPSDCLLFCTCLSELLQIKSCSDLEEIALKYSVALGDIDTPFSVPKIGQPLQHCDCYQDINNIFRAQEWVGYEYKEDHFVYAIILHPIQPVKDMEDPVLITRSYKIKFGEKEGDCIEVSALDLYKLIDHAIEQLDQPTRTRELMLFTGFRSASTKLSDSQKLLELKKNIYQDLTVVQKLPEESRKKALKRLYLNYHPDKAESEEAAIYDDAFKFLLKQIQNLEAGHKLDDPETDSSPSHSGTQQSPWNNYHAWNETAKNMYRRRRKRRSRSRGGPSYTQPAPDNVEAKRWLRQAEADCCSLKVLKRNVQDETKTASTLCFLAHQVVEKALKACMYQLFGLDQSCLQHHQLVCLAEAIHSNIRSDRTKKLCEIASTLEHHYFKSRYPDAHRCPTAPVDVYNVQEAKECAKYAETALKTVQNLMR